MGSTYDKAVTHSGGPGRGSREGPGGYSLTIAQPSRLNHPTKALGSSDEPSGDAFLTLQLTVEHVSMHRMTDQSLTLVISIDGFHPSTF
ncbi:MAG: hypothetical protein ABSC41_10865 [Acidimicrobiales bacterium]|jgi:hypothetical protein